MNILKGSASLILFSFILSGIILVEGGLFSADPPDKVAESNVEPASTNAIKLQDKVWHGKIAANETKQLELNLLFPDEGKFFMEIIAGAYDKNLKVRKILGEYFVNVTVKEGEVGKVEIMTTRPKVTPYKMKPIKPVTANPWDSKWDTMQSKNSDDKPKSIPNPKPSWQLRHSIRAGEALLKLLVSFEPNPKINEPTKLLLSVSSTVVRDSVLVELLIPESIKVIK